MRRFLSYLRKIKYPLAFFAVIWLLLLVVYGLYRLPWEPYFYSMSVALLAGMVAVSVGFWRYSKRYDVLQNLKDNLLVSLEQLPLPEDEIQSQYQEMIVQLVRAYQERESQYQESYGEMTDFYTLWVHQIKTPIAAMGLLLEKESNPRKNSMEMELFKIQQYVGMVLGYLRSDTMNADMVIEKYPLDSMIRQVIRKYARMFILNKISIEYNGVEAQVLTDEKWLVFVLEQIISNALKYTRQGKVAIYMEPGEDKTLVIEDTGMGIRKEDIPRVFERGFTGYNGRKDKRSTGIGLYLCRKILTRLHHEIRIESQVGEGTKVFIDLHSDDMQME